MGHSALIQVMSDAAIKAGKGLIRDFGEIDQLQISKKGTSNFVTNADVRTEKFLQKELSKARPNFGFLLEEGGAIAGKDSAFRWIIDPLDGTSNFIHAVPYFCISIGLEKISGGKSEVTAGVIFDPIHNELFTAERGEGAFLNGRRIMVSGRSHIEDALLVMGNPKQGSGDKKNTYRLLDTLLENKATLRHFGATALDLANVAAGRLDACWYYAVQPWDIAAGMLLVQEAGGLVCSFEGGSVDPHCGSLLASNKALAEPLRTLLDKH